ncbi:exopolysaccharide biosynthesis protein [Roseitalea porphyridii]|uniref:Exopolysaccharide biosynthesis protein n=1 Tax=Roseitalea porphyridii TaxID=1852022 RepID=A0A4P6UZZ7_9HYPH|nr:exopolysaccharide biosynthesis protein [Roseitalea porphyridii]QBK29836.1 exopolysaccharide biosynthesis protein [Roseitalea porphyridii]
MSQEEDRAGQDDGDELRSLTQIVDRTLRETRRDQVAVADVLDAFGHASFAPLLLVPAIAVVTPLSGIPAFSAFSGILIFLIASQWLVGRDHIWLPQWVSRRHVAGDRLAAAMRKIRPWAQRVDRHTRPRLRFLFHRPFRFLPPLACTLFGAMMPFLELVPFSSSLLGAAVVLLSLSMLTRDGLFALVALVPVGGVGWAIATLIS